MNCLDVNVLIYAYRTAAPQHTEYARFVKSLIDSGSPFAIPAIVFNGFFRIVTNSRAFTPSSPFDDALIFAEQLHSLPQCLTIVPGVRHWEIFVRLCVQGQAKANLISDAYLAAMAIEIGGELITADRGFGRWPGLRWRHPLDD
jgi:uncharacterized protein